MKTVFLLLLLEVAVTFTQTVTYTLSQAASKVAIVHEWAIQELPEWQNDKHRVNGQMLETNYVSLVNAFNDGTLLCEITNALYYEGKSRKVNMVCAGFDTIAKRQLFADEFSQPVHDGTIESFMRILDEIYSHLEPSGYVPQQEMIFMSSEKAIFEYLSGEQNYLEQIMDITPIYNLHLRGLLPLEFRPDDTTTLLDHWENFAGSNLVREFYGKRAASGTLGDLSNLMLTRIMSYPNFLTQIAIERGEIDLFHPVIRGLKKKILEIDELKGSYDKFKSILNPYMLQINEPRDRRVLLWSEVTIKAGDTPTPLASSLSPSSSGSGNSYFTWQKQVKTILVMTPLHIAITKQEEADKVLVTSSISVYNIDSYACMDKKLNVRTKLGQSFVFRFDDRLEIVKWDGILKRLR